ncbi:MAG: F-box protein [Propionibacteriaceae bacterium]|nr:F-box protein [Propionibacteriaceae bacterium]
MYNIPLHLEGVKGEPWFPLPNEIILHILEYCNFKDLMKLRWNKFFHNLIFNDKKILKNSIQLYVYALTLDNDILKNLTISKFTQDKYNCIFNDKLYKEKCIKKRNDMVLIHTKRKIKILGYILKLKSIDKYTILNIFKYIDILCKSYINIHVKQISTDTNFNITHNIGINIFGFINVFTQYYSDSNYYIYPNKILKYLFKRIIYHPDCCFLIIHLFTSILAKNNIKILNILNSENSAITKYNLILKQNIELKKPNNKRIFEFENSRYIHIFITEQIFNLPNCLDIIKLLYPIYDLNHHNFNLNTEQYMGMNQIEYTILSNIIQYGEFSNNFDLLGFVQYLDEINYLFKESRSEFIEGDYDNELTFMKNIYLLFTNKHTYNSAYFLDIIKYCSNKYFNKDYLYYDEEYNLYVTSKHNNIFSVLCFSDCSHNYEHYYYEQINRTNSDIWNNGNYTYNYSDYFNNYEGINLLNSIYLEWCNNNIDIEKNYEKNIISKNFYEVDINNILNSKLNDFSLDTPYSKLLDLPYYPTDYLYPKILDILTNNIKFIFKRTAILERNKYIPYYIDPKNYNNDRMLGHHNIYPILTDSGHKDRLYRMIFTHICKKNYSKNI